MTAMDNPINLAHILGFFIGLLLVAIIVSIVEKIRDRL